MDGAKGSNAGFFLISGVSIGGRKRNENKAYQSD